MAKQKKVPVSVLRAREKLIAYRAGENPDGTPHPAKSLRALAREVGLSPSGLAKFLDGTAPYAPTVQLVSEWYARVQRGAEHELVDNALRLSRRLLPRGPTGGGRRPA